MSKWAGWDEVPSGEPRKLSAPQEEEEPTMGRRLMKTLDIGSMSEDEMYLAYVELSGRLPKVMLKDINLEAELVRQLRAMQALQTNTLFDPETPPNQKAQVANSVASVLSTLTKLQNEVYKSERMKKVENLLVAAVKELPTEAQLKFFEQYEQLLKGV